MNAYLEDRRSSRRFLLRPTMPARIDGQDVTLLNVSTGGALVQHALPLQKAVDVEVEMRIGELPAMRVIAAVAWTRDASEFASGFASGIAFEQHLPALGSTLEELARSGRAIAIGWNDEPLGADLREDGDGSS